MRKIIDTHTHINHGAKNDSKEDMYYTAGLNDLIEIGAAAGIDMMFCSTFASVISTEEVVDENEYLYELSQKVENLYQWVVIEPRNKETYAQAERMLKSPKCVGIKIHPPYHKYTYDEYGDEIFSFANDLGAIVLIHPWKEVKRLLPFADRYPNATLIAAHYGDDDIDCITEAKHANIYTDVATSGSIKNKMLEYVVNAIGSERILFGTDTYDPGFIRGRVEYARISDKDKENILYNNAERLFASRI